MTRAQRPTHRLRSGARSVISTGVRIGGYRMTSATQVQSATPAKRILVVEDEPMIRMLLEDMLGELGYTVAAEAARIEEALEATKNADFDLAILDANLNGQPASPVADALVTPRHAVRLCHGLWRGAQALSRPADVDE